MSALAISLLITSLAMAGVLALVFFDTRAKSILPNNLYQRAFAFFTMVAVAGILLTTTIGLTAQHNNKPQALADSVNNRP
jgi:hypothetical protein